MAIDPKQLSSENLSQLALELKLEEVDGDISISPEEATRRSETARLALKDRLDDEYKSGKARLAPTDGRPIPVIGWGDDYYRLLDFGWPWRVAAYIAWASSPKMRRYPRTQEELANSILGLTSDRQISTWRKKNPAIDETIGLMQAAPLMDHRRDAFEALAESAADPSHHGAQDRKTFFTMTTDYVPHQKVDVQREPGDPVDLPTADLQNIVKKGDSQK